MANAATTADSDADTGSPEMKHVRTDAAHESYSYPTSPDTRGSTRVRTTKKHYYFGPHDTPESYVLFGLWKHRLEIDGKAPEAKTLRPLVKELLESSPGAEKRYARNMMMKAGGLAACLAFVVIATVLSTNAFWKFSTAETTAVDGIELSEREVVLVQSLRRAESKQIARIQSVEHVEKMAALFANLKKEGPTHARHVSAKYPLPTP